MSMWYHGTTKDFADAICKSQEFRVRTYFSNELSSAITFGGDYVFYVWFDVDPSTYWQWRCPAPIPTSQIRHLINYNPQLIIDNLQCRRHITEFNTTLYYDDKVKVCDECDGQGQEEYYPTLVRWREIKKVTTCKVCNGHGKVTIDGSDIYTHRQYPEGT